MGEKVALTRGEWVSGITVFFTCSSRYFSCYIVLLSLLTTYLPWSLFHTCDTSVFMCVSSYNKINSFLHGEQCNHILFMYLQAYMVSHSLFSPRRKWVSYRYYNTEYLASSACWRSSPLWGFWGFLYALASFGSLVAFIPHVLYMLRNLKIV